ncbi:MAG: T9SS type A sorting domain-containing protein [Bacteroidales bacterium]|nr:T9SS type A sorting domain-containing protein [Bacteroidales bacterium]MCF8455220.1 T9SS type A sorting domain-containing protein [Bacteroidales bacterium]
MKVITLLLFSLSLSFFALAQPINVYPSLVSDTMLVKEILANPYTEVFNIQFSGDPISYGVFTKGYSDFDMPRGLLLTTGKATNAAGPNNSLSTGYDNTGPSDPDLNALLTNPTTDASVLEFDFISCNNTFHLNLVYGSENYLELIGTMHDIHAVFISGPNPAINPPYYNYNFALIPGTLFPISNNTINHIFFANYFINNFSPFYTTDDALQYDGYTVPINCQVDIVPGETYHVKIAIANVGNGSYDSGLFVSGDLNTQVQSEFTVSLVSTYSNPNQLVEGFPASLHFEKTDSLYFNQSLTTYLVVGNNSMSATPGPDYSVLPDSITIPAGVMSFDYPFDVISDSILETDEWLSIVFDTAYCHGGQILQSNILDSLVFTVGILQPTFENCIGAPSVINTYTYAPDSMVSYLWSDGSTADSLFFQGDSEINNMYYVTISHVGGYFMVDSVHVLISNDSFIMDFYAEAFCNDSLGSIGFFVQNAHPQYSYFWNTSATTQFIDSVLAGDYYVTVIDNLGCIIEDSLIGFNPVPLSMKVDYSIAGCIPSFAIADVNGGTPPYGVYWSNMDYGSQTILSQAGDYWVSVQDGAGCTLVDTFTVVADSSTFLQIADNITIYPCSITPGTIDITVVTGASPYTFNWSNGATTEDLIMASPGNYSVTVIDENYCFQTDSFEILEISQFFVDELIVPVTNCSTYINGAIFLTPGGGTLPYSFQWSTGDTTASIDSLAPGIYYYTASDACNNIIEDSLEIEYSLANYYIIEKGNSYCNDGLGFIRIYPNGTQPFQFHVVNSSTGQFLSYYDSLTVGNYMLHVTYGWLQCTDSAEIINELIDDFIQLDTNMISVDCPGDEVVLHAGYEGSPYEVAQIAYDTIPVSSNAIRLSALLDEQRSGPLPIGFDFTFFNHTYSEFYVGSNGWVCFVPPFGSGDTWDITEIPASNPKYPKAAIMPAFRDWMPSEFLPGGGIFYETIGVSPNRKLVVTMKDIALYNCTTLFGDFQVVVYENGHYADINLTSVPTCINALGWGGEGVCGIQNDEGTIAYVVPGRNETPWEAYNESWRFTPSHIHWYDPSGTQVGIGEEVSFPAKVPGIYYTEYNGYCGLETDSFVIIFNNPALTTEIIPNAVCEGQDFIISLPGWDYYHWDNGASTQSIQIPGAGIYSVSVAAGICIWSTEASIAYEENTNEYNYDPNICEGDTILFHTSQDYTYLWDNGSSDTIFPISASGNYFVTVSTLNCEWHDSFEVAMRPLPLGILPSDTTMCLNDTFEIDAGGTSYAYLWNNGSANAILATDTAGLFIVDKSDAYGCSITDSVLITYQADVSSAFNFFEAFNHVQFINQSQNAYYYFWDFGDGSPISNESNPEHDYPVLNQNMWYTATLVSANQCGSDTSMMQIFTFDIEEMDGESPIQIYPNPNKGDFFLAGSLESKDELILHIYNSTGQEIYKKEISSTEGKLSEEIEMGQVASGIYFLMVQQKENKWVWKMVVE